MPACTAQTLLQMSLLGARGVWKGQLTLNVAQSDLVTYPGNKGEFVIRTENQNVSNSSLCKPGKLDLHEQGERSGLWRGEGVQTAPWAHTVVSRTSLFLPILQTISLASFSFYEQIVGVLWFLKMTFKTSPSLVKNPNSGESPCFSLLRPSLPGEWSPCAAEALH